LLQGLLAQWLPRNWSIIKPLAGNVSAHFYGLVHWQSPRKAKPSISNYRISLSYIQHQENKSTPAMMFRIWRKSLNADLGRPPQNIPENPDIKWQFMFTSMSEVLISFYPGWVFSSNAAKFLLRSESPSQFFMKWSRTSWLMKMTSPSSPLF